MSGSESTVTVTVNRDASNAIIAMDRPDQRNALDIAMFDAIDDALAKVASDADLVSCVLIGHGPAFCAGFDLPRVIDDPALMGRYIERLSTTIRAIRRLPQVVIASVQGAAIAGGCAIVSSCDFVVATAESSFGYPVHRIGVSPAVSLPTLRLTIGDGEARALMQSGRIINGTEAKRLGLVSHLAGSEDDLLPATRRLVEQLAQHGPNAVRVTKAWMNELDGSLDDTSFEQTSTKTADLAGGDEAIRRLDEFWTRRQQRS